MTRATQILAAGLGIAHVTAAADLSGHYYLRNVREVGSELLLKKDGTFEFMLAYGAADYWAKGKWRAAENAVVLDGDPGDGKPPLRLVSSAASKSSNQIQIRVLAPGGRGVPNIDVTLVSGNRERSKARTDSDGISAFPPTPDVKSAEFEIRVYSFKSGPLALNPAHNDFSFEINGEAITCVPFKGERLVLDKEDLLMRFWGPDQEMRYSRKNE